MTALPVVSIVVPMLDEIGYIGACLDGFAAQTYPHELLDVVIVDGGSRDGSRDLVMARSEHEPWIRLVENPARKASAAFNRGVEAARGDVVFIFSAHGVPSTTYVERSVTALSNTSAVGVGGRYLHRGTNPSSNAIGLAMVSPFGMASTHRYSVAAGLVDTISHPAYWRSALQAVGPFDETLERNSDYELNWRLRERGDELLFDPTIESVYRPRPGSKALARQFWWYGRWKARAARRHPRSLRPRHLVAPAFVAGLAASPLLLRTRGGRRLIAFAGLAYGAGVAAATAAAHPADHDASAAVLAASFPVMHVTWGAGFLASTVEELVTR